MKFKEAWDKLEAKICLQRQSAEYLFAFYVFINCSNSKKSQILAGIYLIFLRIHPIPKLEVFQCQIYTSVKTLE